MQPPSNSWKKTASGYTTESNPGGHLKLLHIKTILVLVLTLMSSVPILSFGILQAYRWREFTESTDEGQAIGQVQALDQEIRKVLEIRMSALELMAEQIRMQSGHKPIKGPEYYPMLELYVEKFGMQTAGVAALDGHSLELYNHVPSKRVPLMKVNIRSMGYIDSILSVRDSVVTPVVKAILSGRNLFVIATPIWDYDRKNIRAVIASSVFAEEIQRIANRVLETTPLFRFMLLDQNQQVIAESGMTDFRAPLKSAGGSIFSFPSNTSPTIHSGMDQDGNKLVGAVKTLQIRPGIQWKLLVAESEASLHRQEQQAWNQAFLVTSIGVGLSLIVAFLLSALISKPILDLITSMKKIEEGKITNVHSLPRKAFGFRETSEAWEALSTMTQKLSGYTENLEAEVSQRTSELIQTHRQLDEQRARAMESARLASLGEMAGGIAHEINNPLSIISLITQQQRDLIDRNKLDPQNIKEAFRRIDSTTHRIAKIIQGLRRFSREGGNDPLEHSSLQSILENTLTFCYEKFKHKEIELRVAMPQQEITLYCRPVQISQVLLNLLGNAFDAVQNLPTRWIEIQITDLGKEVQLRVTDSGSGIDPALREKIFQPFFTSKETGKGTGLGLSISKGIIEAHQGRIYVDSEKPHTSFVIQLPKV